MSDSYVWRYLHAGTVAHALGQPGDEAGACGVSTWAHLWRGTGTQDEYDQAASLPRCRRCLKAIGATS